MRDFWLRVSIGILKGMLTGAVVGAIASIIIEWVQQHLTTLAIPT